MVYVDVDHDDDLNDHKSQSGYVVFLNGSPIIGLVTNNNVLQVQQPKLNMLMLSWLQRKLFGYAIFLQILGAHNLLQQCFF